MVEWRIFGRQRPRQPIRPEQMLSFTSFFEDLDFVGLDEAWIDADPLDFTLAVDGDAGQPLEATPQGERARVAAGARLVEDWRDRGLFFGRKEFRL